MIWGLSTTPASFAERFAIGTTMWHDAIPSLDKEGNLVELAFDLAKVSAYGDKPHGGWNAVRNEEIEYNSGTQRRKET